LRSKPPRQRRGSASPSAPRRGARAIQVRALRDFLRWLGTAGDASLVELPGVTAAVVPATRERSVTNSVAYEDEASLAAAYDELAAAYDGAGIAAWTVWTPEADRQTVELLEARGHLFDGEPAAMTLDLADLRSAPGDVDWDDDASFEELGRLNDEAYGYAPGTGYAAALVEPSASLPMRIFRAREGRETVSVMATIDHEDDLGIYFVATPERHRGRGLASRLLSAVLAAGRERGMRTSSLQASAKGAGLYERLGYRRRFRLHLYERRE
jgi:ribosomal protein S18 acetylase RimI-like enzyme